MDIIKLRQCPECHGVLMEGRPCAACTRKSGFVLDANGVVTDYDGERENVEVPYGVTGIGDMAMALHIEVRSLILPTTLRHIGSRAFMGVSVTELVIPEGVEELGAQTLGFMLFLKRLYLPASLKHIGELQLISTEKVEEIIYSGTREQWESICIDESNTQLRMPRLTCIGATN